jgi:hypothetical protein
MALEREMETFRRELPNLLRTETNRDKFVLIHNDKVDSIWDTVEEALDAGYERFGLDVFLAQKITEHEKPVYFSRNLTRCQ